ncbi:type III secretion protein HrpE [Escherichia albertii]|uniref:type III secretion protein HrpE n=1 Tax=Escherichia albertii TaxID=208962 RepID=UPI0010F837CD|nr:type III secretion protein HrpE [Escherichia albertii]
MLRKISLSPHFHLVEQPLIKAKSFRSASHFTTVEQQARQYAQHLLREARREAAAVRTEAWLEGYSDGIGQASKAVIDHVNNVESMAKLLLSAAQQKLETQLQALFSHEESTEALFKLIARSLGRHIDEDRKAIITLPLWAVNSATTIREAFYQSGITTELQTTQDNELRVEYGQQIWRCELPRQMTLLAKMALDSVRGELDIEARLAIFQQQAIHQLAQTATPPIHEA